VGTLRVEAKVLLGDRSSRGIRSPEERDHLASERFGGERALRGFGEVLVIPADRLGFGPAGVVREATEQERRGVRLLGARKAAALGDERAAREIRATCVPRRVRERDDLLARELSRTTPRRPAACPPSPPPSSPTSPPTRGGARTSPSAIATSHGRLALPR
jgi:hypothetical protein